MSTKLTRVVVFVVVGVAIDGSTSGIVAALVIVIFNVAVGVVGVVVVKRRVAPNLKHCHVLVLG